MDLWSRIPVVTIVLTAACPDRSNGTATDTAGTSGSESGGTTASADWPPVECGEVTCLPGEFCVVERNDCSFIDDPCGSGGTTGYDPTDSGTGGGDPNRCVHVEPGPRRCFAIPIDCKAAQSGIEWCLDNNGFCYGDFYDGVLVCRNGSYGECGLDGEGSPYPYCSACLHDEDDPFD